jgi:hypothetical protein
VLKCVALADEGIPVLENPAARPDRFAPPAGATLDDYLGAGAECAFSPLPEANKWHELEHNTN